MTKDVPIEIREIEGGAACVLAVRAQPGARRDGVAGAWNGMLKVAVSAPAAEGRANARLVATLAEVLGLRASAVVLVAGEHARTKKFRLAADARLVRARIDALLA